MNRIKQIIVWPFQWFLRRGMIVRLLIIAAIIGLGWFGYSRMVQTKPAAIQQQTTQVEQGTLITSVTSSGSVTAGNSASISTTTSGVVSEVYVKDGDSVTQGQVIAVVTPDLTAQQKQASAWASYVSAQSGSQTAQNNLRTAQANLDKAVDDIHLFQYGNGGFDNVGSSNETMAQRQSRTQAEVSLNNAQENVKTSQAQLSAAWLTYQQSSATIYAPITGIVSGLTLTPGLQITASTTSTGTSTATTVGTVTLQSGTPQAQVNLTEIDVVKVKPNQKVTMTVDAFPEKTFTGKVVTINTTGSVSSGVTTYPATISFDTAVDNLYPNMAVTATIISNVKHDVLLVPSAAVQTANGVSTVQVVKDGQTNLVSVETGESNDTQTEILSGLNAGDTVVTGIVSTTRTGSGGTSPFGNTGGFGGGGFGGGGNIQIRRMN